MADLLAFEDPANLGNSTRYHTGKRCIEPGCQNPAGTRWSQLWCFEHNVARVRRISEQFAELEATMPPPEPRP